MLVRIKLEDAVDGAKEGRLATARGPDDRRDRIRRDAHVDVLQRGRLAVVEAQVAHDNGAWRGFRAGGVQCFFGLDPDGCRAVVHLLMPFRASSRTRMLRISTKAVSTKAPAQASVCHSS